MRNQTGYVAGYNGQAVVTAQQVIVGVMLSQHPVDRTLLHPVLDTCRQQLTQAGIRPELRTVLADAGYVSEENLPAPTRTNSACSRRWPKTPAGRAGALRTGSSTWTSIRPPPAPSGGCDIPADERTTSCGPAPWNRCSGS